MLRTFLRKSHNKEPEKGRFFRVQVELRIKLFLIQNIVDDIYIYILHYLNGPRLWEVWYIPYG